MARTRVTTFADVTAVVTAHNAGAELEARIRRLTERASFAALWIIDSGSADGSVETVAAAIRGVRTHRFDDNVGPCVTRNQGLDLAETPYVLWLDDDTEIGADAIEALRTALVEDERCAMVGPSLRYEDRPHVVQYEGGVCHFAGLPHMTGHDAEGDGGAPREVDVLTSGCLLVRRQPLRSIGGFDAALFFLMEDVELSLRLRIAGWRLRVVPAAVAFNVGGSEGLSLRTREYPERRIYLHARNRWLVVFGLWERTSLFVLWPALLLFELAWLAFAILSGHPVAYLRGKLAVLGMMPHVRAVRRRVADSRVVRDSVLLAAPPLTFTASALAQPLARRCARVLDAMLRMYFHAARVMLP